jgi:hypothetical protein
VKEISWTRLKQNSLENIKEGECLRVTGDGEVAFYAVVRPVGMMPAKIEALCSQIDASKGMG